MRQTTVAVCWALTLGALPVPTASAAEEPPHLVLCDAFEASRAGRDRSRELADHLGDGYAGSYPSAVALARAMAEISAAFDAQLNRVAPASEAFFEAWGAFDQLIRRSPLPRDPALRQVLPAYKHSVEELTGQLGCADPGAGGAMIVCTAIPIAHLLAVLGGQLQDYIAERHAESYPEQAEAGRELARTARVLHEVLHDLEIAVPGIHGTFETLAGSLDGSSLTDTDEPQDVEVKSRLAAVAETIAALETLVGSCHAPGAAESASAAHDHP